MASVDFRCKCKGGSQAKAIFRHCAKDTREKGRHSNGDIDRQKTKENSSLYGLSYQEVCEKYDSRIKELDSTSNKNKRKDRVTLLSLSIPVPDGLLSSVDEERFFAKVNKLLCKRYGKSNILDVVIHRDEKHIYIDPDTKEQVMSRTHAHCFIVPEREGGLNAKWCSGRSNINAVNQEIHEMSKKDFGLPFMTGAKAKSRGKVEHMKMRSALETLRMAENKEAELEERERKLDEYEKELRELITKYISDVEELRKSQEQVELDIQNAERIAERSLDAKIKRFIEFSKRITYCTPVKKADGSPMTRPKKRGQEEIRIPIADVTSKTVYEQFETSEQRRKIYANDRDIQRWQEQEHFDGYGPSY